MTKEEQNKYLSSLKEYRDWYAVLTTAENKGIQKGLQEAQKKIEEAYKEKEKAQKEKNEAIKKNNKAIIRLYNLGITIKELAQEFKMSEKEIEELINIKF